MNDIECIEDLTTNAYNELNQYDINWLTDVVIRTIDNTSLTNLQTYNG